MEKKKAHYPLTAVQALVKEGNVKASKTALAGAAALGFDFEGMKEVVSNLEASDFYKSMTSYTDSKVWQDVYHFPSEDAGEIYLKLSLIEKVLIVSFKEK